MPQSRVLECGRVKVLKGDSRFVDTENHGRLVLSTEHLDERRTMHFEAVGILYIL